MLALALAAGAADGGARTVEILVEVAYDEAVPEASVPSAVETARRRAVREIIGELGLPPAAPLRGALERDLVRHADRYTRMDESPTVTHQGTVATVAVRLRVDLAAIAEAAERVRLEVWPRIEVHTASEGEGCDLELARVVSAAVPSPGAPAPECGGTSGAADQRLAIVLHTRRVGSPMPYGGVALRGRFEGTLETESGAPIRIFEGVVEAAGPDALTAASALRAAVARQVSDGGAAAHQPPGEAALRVVGAATTSGLRTGMALAGVDLPGAVFRAGGVEWRAEPDLVERRVGALDGRGEAGFRLEAHRTTAGAEIRILEDGP